MVTSSVEFNLAHPLETVKPAVNLQVPLVPDSMIHHKIKDGKSNIIIRSRRGIPTLYYGVSSAWKAISAQLLLKRWNQVRDCLQNTVGLTTAQREVALRLLTFATHYRDVYVKEITVTAEPGCSKVTYWRTVRLLEEAGLLQVFNRFIVRQHAQISNLYRLDRLILLVARYLAEHGVPFLQRELQPALRMEGSLFWPWILGVNTERVPMLHPVLVGPLM